MIGTAISTALLGIALWAGYAVLRTAVELREELRVPVRDTPRTPQWAQARGHYRRHLSGTSRPRLRRVA